MRISDWSSDVCSSDLGGIGARRAAVACRRDEADGSIWLETSHDGYLPVFGLTHHRRLFLSASGDDLRGEDRFTAETSGAARPCAVGSEGPRVGQEGVSTVRSRWSPGP